MLRRVPKALKVGFRAGFNSFVATLKPTRRRESMVFWAPTPPVRRSMISGDIWWKTFPDGRTPEIWVFDGNDFAKVVDRNA